MVFECITNRGGYLYSLLKNSEKLSVSLLLPLQILLIYTYIFSLGDTLENWDVKYCFSMPLLRGVADMSLGIMLAYLNTNKRIINYKSVLFNVLSVLSLCLFVVLLFLEETCDKYVLILLPIIILALVEPDSWLYKVFDNKRFAFLGEMSFLIYVVHWGYVYLYGRIVYRMLSSCFGNVPMVINILIFVIGLTLSAYLFKKGVDYVTSLVTKKQ